jgi:hypothetical protein
MNNTIFNLISILIRCVLTTAKFKTPHKIILSSVRILYINWPMAGREKRKATVLQSEDAKLGKMFKESVVCLACPFNSYAKTMAALLQQVLLHEKLKHKMPAPFVTVTN